MKEVSVQELKEMIDNQEDFQLVDVREQHEFDFVNLNGILIPMNEVPDNVDKISRDKKVVIHCRSGARSGRICEFLESQYGYDNVYNLAGGILAWADQIDTDLPKY